MEPCSQLNGGVGPREPRRFRGEELSESNLRPAAFLDLIGTRVLPIDPESDAT